MQAPYGVPQGQPQGPQPKRYDGKNGQPMYDAGHGGHYGASAQIAAAGHQPPPETFTGHWQNVSEDMNFDDSLESFRLMLLFAGISRAERTISRYPEYLLAKPSHQAGDR